MAEYFASAEPLNKDEVLLLFESIAHVTQILVVRALSFMSSKYHCLVFQGTVWAI
jgi:hypothetical protein